MTTYNARNSTDVPLLNGEIFVGRSQETGDYATLSVGVITDQDGVLYIEQSPDGTNWDLSQSFDVISTVQKSEIVIPTYRYARVRFENNSGADQTYIRLQTIFSKERSDRDLNVGYKLSVDNSSNTSITTGSNFSGTFEDISKFNSLVVSVKTDQDGYYEIQFSPDGVNVDSTLTRYYRTNQIDPPHRFTITRSFFRIVFYNTSASDQTFFRMQVLLGDKSDLNIPLDSTISQDYDSLSVRPTDFSSECALERRQGVSTWNKFGYNLDVDTASGDEIIASWGGTFQFLTSGETIDIVSSSVNDIVTTGTGAQRVVVYGVDENWDSQIEVFDLNGTTTVTSSSLWIGINRVSIYIAGSSLSNEGDIDITASTSGFQMAQMPAGESTTQQVIFYVARKHKFLATWFKLGAQRISGGSSPVVTFNGKVFSAVSNAIYQIYRNKIDTQVLNNLEISPVEPFIVGEKSILWFTAATTTNNTEVNARFSGKLFRDVDA
jgi:hypothetical protein